MPRHALLKNLPVATDRRDIEAFKFYNWVLLFSARVYVYCVVISTCSANACKTWKVKSEHRRDGTVLVSKMYTAVGKKHNL